MVPVQPMVNKDVIAIVAPTNRRTKGVTGSTSVNK